MRNFDLKEKSNFYVVKNPIFKVLPIFRVSFNKRLSLPKIPMSVNFSNKTCKKILTFQLLVPVVAPMVKARVTAVVEAAVSTYTEINQVL